VSIIHKIILANLTGEEEMLSRLTGESISIIFRRALEENNLISDGDTAIIFYDLSYLTERINNLISLFPETTLHAIAVKANPLVNVLKKIKKLGIGLEAASIPELYLAVKSGFSSNNIVFDSPVKTITEIEYALNLNCHINADSLYELDRISELLNNREPGSKSTIGIRINPQVGTGKIALSSVAGEYSKFGVPIRENRQALLDKFEKYDWLTGVHLHMGSQGYSVEMLLKGIEIILDFVEETNEILTRKNTGRKINIFDIGGGLPVSYHSVKEAVSMSYYVKEMRERFKRLFSGEFKLITEFGRYIHANTGWTASKVEYVKREANINTVMIHVGADLLLRKCYNPEDWHHEIFVVGHNGMIKDGTDKNKYVIAGPLCFAGDVIANGIEMPIIEPGDYIIIQDTGAYTLSMWSRYNSRQIPKVIGYTEEGNDFEIIKERECLDNIFEFWS
jgi:diaminopimelate decarboxylase